VTRLLRILFKTAAALSLLLCICFAALWLRSYFTPDALAFRHLTPNASLAIFSIHSYHGRIGIEYERHWLDPANPPQLGLSLRSGPAFWLPGGWATAPATIPHWHLLIYTAVLPAWWFIRRHISLPALQTRRRNRGLCPTCGYDLRSSPTLCPECGAVPLGAAP
jgi:hypothetical protein